MVEWPHRASQPRPSLADLDAIGVRAERPAKPEATGGRAQRLGVLVDRKPAVPKSLLGGEPTHTAGLHTASRTAGNESA